MLELLSTPSVPRYKPSKVFARKLTHSFSLVLDITAPRSTTWNKSKLGNFGFCLSRLGNFGFCLSQLGSFGFCLSRLAMCALILGIPYDKSAGAILTRILIWLTFRIFCQKLRWLVSRNGGSITCGSSKASCIRDSICINYESSNEKLINLVSSLFLLP